MQQPIEHANQLGPLFTKADGPRLVGGMKKVRDYCLGLEFRTLKDIEDATDVPQASASAHLRHLTREEFGGYIKQMKSYPGVRGCYGYRLLPPHAADTEDKLRRRGPAVVLAEARGLVREVVEALELGNFATAKARAAAALETMERKRGAC